MCPTFFTCVWFFKYIKFYLNKVTVAFFEFVRYNSWTFSIVIKFFLKHKSFLQSFSNVPQLFQLLCFLKKWLDIIFFMIEYFISFINILIHFPTKNVSLLDQICFGIILFRLISLLCWNIPSNNSKYCVHCIKTNTAKFCNWINYWNGKTRNHLNMNLTVVYPEAFRCWYTSLGFVKLLNISLD